MLHHRYGPILETWLQVAILLAVSEELQPWVQDNCFEAKTAGLSWNVFTLCRMFTGSGGWNRNEFVTRACGNIIVMASSCSRRCFRLVSHRPKRIGNCFLNAPSLSENCFCDGFIRVEAMLPWAVGKLFSLFWPGW